MPQTRDFEPTDTAGSGDPPSGSSAEPAGRPGGRRAAIAGAAVLLVLVAAYVAGALLLGDRVPRSTSVAGVDIGGLSRSDAQVRLTEELATQLADRSVPVSVGGTESEIALADAVSLDAEATVEEASAGSAWNPVHLVRVVLGGQDDVSPVIEADETGLTTALETLAADTDVAPVDGTVSFEGGTVATTAPVTGTALDVAGSVDLVIENVLADERLALPVEESEPAIDQAELDRAVTEFAEPAMSAPVTVTAGATEVPLAPADIAPFLAMVAEGGGLAPALDVEGLLAADPDRFASVIKPPVSASFTFEGDAPKIVPAVDGTTIDPASLSSALLQALVAGPDARTAEVSTTTAEPELTTAEAEALGIKEPIGEFQTEYPIAEYRIINIGRAAELINGSLVVPGATWSLNETVGERTAENGFVKGFIIDGGQFREDFGGGVSQAATTTFNAVFFSGLEDVEHKPHSFYISRYPAGREATVAWPTVDLKFRNDTETGVLIQAIATPGQITVRFWGTKAYDEIRSVSSERYNIVGYDTLYQSGEDCVDQPPVSGFDITVTREFVIAGEVVRSEDFVTHYNPADHIICQ